MSQRQRRTYSNLIAVLALSSTVAAQQSLPPGVEKLEAPPLAPQPDITNPHKPFNLMVGDPAPKIDFRDWILGEPVTTLEPGKVYLIHPFAVWCDPCNAILPRLTELQNEYESKGLVVIGVTSPGQTNTREAVEKFVFDPKNAIGFRIAWDRRRAHMDDWVQKTGRTSLPCVMIVDQEGKLAYAGGVFEFESTLREIMEQRHNIELMARQYYDCISASWAYTHWIQKVESKDWPGVANLGREIVFGRGNNCPALLGNIAWTIVDPSKPLEHRDLELALAAATRADELQGGKDPFTIDTLARVHFEKGDAAKAIELQERAILRAISEAQRQRFRQTLDEYRMKASAPR